MPIGYLQLGADVVLHKSGYSGLTFVLRHPVILTQLPITRMSALGRRGKTHLRDRADRGMSARIAVLRSDRHARVEVNGDTLAESSRSMMLIEISLPVRWYLPRTDVRMDLLTPSDRHTVCAYKGIASHLSADGAPDVAWFYPDPLDDALRVKDPVGFWRPAKVFVDGKAVDTSMPGD